MSYANRLSTRKICTNQHDSVAGGEIQETPNKEQYHRQGGPRGGGTGHRGLRHNAMGPGKEGLA